MQTQSSLLKNIYNAIHIRSVQWNLSFRTAPLYGKLSVTNSSLGPEDTKIHIHSLPL